MRERLKIIFESEVKINVERVTETLKSSGLEYKSVSREKIGSLPKPSSKKCCGDKKKPGLLEKGIGFTKALKEHAMSGMSHVPQSVSLERLTTCVGCDESDDKLVCNKCGCYMGIKATWDIKGICKLNKW